MDGMPLKDVISAFYGKRQAGEKTSRLKNMVLVTKNGESLKQNRQIFAKTFEILKELKVRPILIIVDDANVNAATVLLGDKILGSDELLPLSFPISVREVAKEICGEKGRLLQILYLDAFLFK